MIPVEVFRDEVLLVVDKPSGMPSQPDREGSQDLYRLLAAREPYVGLHHRLDRPASGLVLLTLAERVNAAIAEAFRTHAIQRDYLAVLAGDGLVAGERFAWSDPLDGQEAHTDGEVLGAGGGLLAVRLQPRTGRTHQLRRHAAMHGLPMVGDRRHGGAVGSWLPRLALHAARMRLRHPETGARLDLRAPLPEALAGAWAAAGGQPAIDDQDG
ncbi:MAG: RluA family pseudouridine synthase [Alphaproteobacteria bacterium]|nr:RluA family pseudouridine synthase [Alphaproteobacteria bacterium]